MNAEPERGHCPTEDEVLEFVGHRLSARATRSIDAHIDGCGRCSALLAELALMVSTEEQTPGPLDATTSAAVGRGSKSGDFLDPGTQVGRYTVEALVGVGAMGAVYRAHDPALARHVAIKVLHASSTVELSHEAQALAKLEHDNVVSVFDFGVHERRAFVVVEFIAGRTLKTWLAAEPPTTRILSALAAAGRGLQAAHAVGIVHRDFKPSNVLIGDDGRVAVTDFGLAQQTRAHTRTQGNDVAQDPGTTTSPIGTPAYMAPEQATDSRGTPLSDQYSYCVTAYEALVGVRPETDSAASAHALTAQGKAMTPAVVEALVRGLSPRPSQRHVSMAALVQALEASAVVAPRRWRGTALGLLALVGALAVWVLARQPAGPSHGPPPQVSTPQANPQLAAAQAALQDAKAHDRLGDYAAALDALQRAQRLAQPLADSRLHAQIAFGRGRLSARLDPPGVAIEALQRAHAIALGAGQDDLAAMAALSLVRLHAHGAGHVQPARTWLGHARAAVIRSGSMQAQWLATAALLHSADGRHWTATTYNLMAAGMFALEGGLNSPKVSLLLTNAAASLSTLERYVAAGALLQYALAELVRAWGPEHPRLAGVHVNLGIVWLEGGRYDEAAEQCQRALLLLQRAHGMDHPETTLSLQCLADIDIGRGRLAAAEQTLLRASEIEKQSLAPESLHHSVTLELRVSVALWQGRTEHALSMARRSLQLRHAALGPDNAVTAFAMLRLGDALLQAERRHEATAQLEAAFEIFSRTVEPDDEFMVRARASLGESLVGTPRNGEALSLLETADPRIAQWPGRALERARVAFALARAVQAAGGDADRVDALLARVRADLRGLPATALSRQVDAWVAAPG